MRKVTIIVAFFLLVAGVASVATIHYMEDEREAMNAVSQPKTAAVIPSGAIDAGEGRYIKYLEKDGKTYAGVVIPRTPSNNVCEERRPGHYRQMARGLLEIHDEHRLWTDEKQEKKGDQMVVVFRLITPDEQRQAKEAGEEMSKPLDLEGMK